MKAKKPEIQAMYDEWLSLRRSNPEEATEALNRLEDKLEDQKDHAEQVKLMQGMVNRQIAEDAARLKPEEDKRRLRDALERSEELQRMRTEQAEVDAIRADRRKTAKRLALTGKSSTFQVECGEIRMEADGERMLKDGANAIRILGKRISDALGPELTQAVRDGLKESVDRCGGKDGLEKTGFVARRKFSLPSITTESDAQGLGVKLVGVFGDKSSGLDLSLLHYSDAERDRKFKLKKQ